MGDHRPHLRCFIQPIAEPDVRRGLDQLGLQWLVHITDSQHQRTGQAALPRRAKGRGEDSRDRALQRRVRHHHQAVLRARLALRPFAVSRRCGVDVLPHRRRADEGNARHVRMAEEHIHYPLIPVEQADHARREIRLVEQFEQPVLADRAHFRGLDDVSVTASHGGGQEPPGNHRREVEGRDAGENPHRLQHALLVNAGGDVLGVVAHHQRGDSRCQFHVLDGAAHLATGLVQDFAVFLHDGASQILEMLLHQGLEAEHSARPCGRRGLAPFPEGLLRYRNSAGRLLHSGERNLGDDLRRGRIFHVQPLT